MSNEVTVNVTYKKPLLRHHLLLKLWKKTKNLSISVVANGKGLSYQWQKNGSNIADAREVIL